MVKKKHKMVFIFFLIQLIMSIHLEYFLATKPRKYSFG